MRLRPQAVQHAAFATSVLRVSSARPASSAVNLPCFLKFRDLSKHSAARIRRAVTGSRDGPLILPGRGRPAPKTRHSVSLQSSEEVCAGSCETSGSLTMWRRAGRLLLQQHAGLLGGARSYASSQGSRRADVVIVGAGHNGLVSALLLARQGLKVRSCRCCCWQWLCKQQQHPNSQSGASKQ